MRTSGLILLFLLISARAFAASSSYGADDPQRTAEVSTGTFKNYQRAQAENGRWFAVTTDLKTVSSANETDFFLFTVLSTATVSAFLENVRFGCQSTISTWKVYRGPVVTSSGTALSIFPGLTSSTRPTQVAAYHAPTISSRGTPVFLSICNEDIRQEDLHQSRIFTPGRTFLVTVDNVGTNQTNSFDMEWSEEPTP